MALLEIDKQLINAKTDFLISASKFKILFVSNISLALLRRQRPNILRYTLFYATRSFENVVFLYCVQNRDNKTLCKNFYITQYRTILLHLLNSLTKRFDLQYNNIICLNISASSLLLFTKYIP